MATVEQLTCPGCGASVSLGRKKCDFCRSTLIISDKGVTSNDGGSCPSCGKEIKEGQEICMGCATIISESPELLLEIKKAVFSQEKGRKNYPKEVCEILANDEYILAETSGTDSWSIVTPKRILIFKRTIDHIYGELIKQIPFDEITGHTSPQFEIERNVYLRQPIVFWFLGIETFSGDYLVEGLQHHPDIPDSEFPYYYNMFVVAYENHKNKILHYRAALFMAGKARKAELQIDKEAPIAMSCPSCGAKVRGKAKYADKVLSCPKCNSQNKMTLLEPLPLIKQEQDEEQSEMSLEELARTKLVPSKKVGGKKKNTDDSSGCTTGILFIFVIILLITSLLL